MPFVLSPEQELIQKVTREFASRDLVAQATQMDRTQEYPVSRLEAMAPLGLLGMLVGTESGGAGTDTVSFVLAAEEIGRVSGTDAAILVLTNALVSLVLERHGTEKQRKELLAPVLEGRKRVAVALTEEASGTAYEGVHTTLAGRDGTLELRGSKAYVAMATLAEDFLVLARATEGPTLVRVPAKAKGLHVGESESKLGLRALPLADVYFNRVQVAPEDLVGKAGEGLVALEEPLDLVRLGVAAGLVGLTQACLDSSIAFAKERRQFGQPIARFGAIRGMLADVEAELEAARATALGAAALRDFRKPFQEQTLEARLLAHRIAVRGSRIAHKIHGGAGFMRDLPLERYSRDIRTMMHLWDPQDVGKARLASVLLDGRA